MSQFYVLCRRVEVEVEQSPCFTVLGGTSGLFQSEYCAQLGWRVIARRLAVGGHFLRYAPERSIYRCLPSQLLGQPYNFPIKEVGLDSALSAGQALPGRASHFYIRRAAGWYGYLRPFLCQLFW